MEINFHPMTEEPVVSCEVVLMSKWNTLFITNYSVVHQGFNVKDRDSHKEANLMKLDADRYVGWVFADEMREEMRKAYDQIHG